MKLTKLSSIMNTEALEYALYTVSNRAIPHGIDGLKPVHRFCLYSTLKSASTQFKKVAALAGVVSDLGYHHGETSAQDALKLMAAEWTNNISIIEGEGNFGSRQVNDSAAARYVFAKIGSEFHRYFKDVELSPVHKDKEHIPPAFYVPVIPVVLANYISGIATGFACKILPHDPEWLKKSMIELVNGLEVSTEPVIKFPEFNGKVSWVSGTQQYIQTGLFTTNGLTVTVTELPTTFDHDKYIKVLEELKEKGSISSFKDDTSDGFNFIIKMKRGFKMEPARIVKVLKLAKPFTQNINVINAEGLLTHYDHAVPLMEDFCKFRMGFLQKRIEHGIQEAIHVSMLSNAKVAFIDGVIAGDLVLHGKTRAVITKELKQLTWAKDYVTILLSMSVDKMTDDEKAKLLKEAKEADKHLKYWETTTPKAEFLKDLKEI